MQDEIRIIDNSWQQPLQASDDLYKNRKETVRKVMELEGKSAEVTVVIQAYNQLEKVKRCTESVLKYTQDVKYELILFDNGSEEPVFEYFKSVQCSNKKIIRVEKNISAGFPGLMEDSRKLCPYFVDIAGDIVVTKNWLSNMLKVAKSDPRIGMISPVCNNVSNLQNVELQYSNLDEMQEAAEKYNVSDASKWEERLRLVTVGTLFTRECLYAIGWPRADMGFMHDFGDDDIAFRVRRAGYKVVLAGDTWICHDHPVSSRFNNEKVQKSIACGRQNFIDKYFGIDAWNDTINYVYYILGQHIKNVQTPVPTILGIDVKCGTPILDIKNQLRRFNKNKAVLSAFTQEDKYSVDLHTICDEDVVCDREEFLRDSFLRDSFDYIIIGSEINRYHEPPKVLLDAYELLKPGGQLFFSLKNSESVLTYLHMMGYEQIYDKEYCVNYQIGTFVDSWKKSGLNIRVIEVQRISNIGEDVQSVIRKILETYGTGNKTEMLNRMMVEKYWLVIEK